MNRAQLDRLTDETNSVFLGRFFGDGYRAYLLGKTRDGGNLTGVDIKTTKPSPYDPYFKGSDYLWSWLLGWDTAESVRKAFTSGVVSFDSNSTVICLFDLDDKHLRDEWILAWKTCAQLDSGVWEH